MKFDPGCRFVDVDAVEVKLKRDRAAVYLNGAAGITTNHDTRLKFNRSSGFRPRVPAIGRLSVPARRAADVSGCAGLYLLSRCLYRHQFRHPTGLE